MISCVKTVPSKLQWLSYCISLTVYTSSCVFTTDRAAGLELSSALTHARSLADFILLYELLRSPPVQAALHCFPDICSTFPFCVAGERKWNGKSSPPPTVATWQGRRAVGQEPAGHSRAYLWSAFSSLQSEALCSPDLPLYSVLLPCVCFFAVSHRNWSQEQPEKMHFLLTHYAPPLLLSFLSQTIYTGGVDT